MPSRLDKQIDRCSAAIHNIISRAADANPRHWEMFQEQLTTKQGDLDRLKHMRDGILKEVQFAPAMPHSIDGDVVDSMLFAQYLYTVW